MKLEIMIILATTVTANVGVSYAKWTDITFPLKVLQPDLRAFSQYYEKIDNTVYAYLHWPDGISYQVHVMKHKDNRIIKRFLKISGIFKQTKMLFLVTRYDGIYYKNGQFFAWKRGSLKKISPDTLVQYVQPEDMTIKPETTYLSIKYFSLEELQEEIKQFYFKYQNSVKNVRYRHPATFLATPPNEGGHFVEYTFSSGNSATTLADGKLRILRGTAEKGKLSMENNIEAYRLVFDPYRHICTVPESFDISSTPFENVYGVRMASVGFLAEIRQSVGKTLLLSDLDVIDDTDFHLRMSLRDLLQKVKTVQPKYNLDLFSTEDAPTHVKFQMLGQVLVKSANFKNGGVDKNCPFTIEYAKKGRFFAYKDRMVDKLYTNDTAIWAEGEGPLPVPDEAVALM